MLSRERTSKRAPALEVRGVVSPPSFVYFLHRFAFQVGQWIRLSHVLDDKRFSGQSRANFHSVLETNGSAPCKCIVINSFHDHISDGKCHFWCVAPSIALYVPAYARKPTSLPISWTRQRALVERFPSRFTTCCRFEFPHTWNPSKILERERPTLELMPVYSMV